MTEKRVFPRRGRRLLVEFSHDGTVRTGFTRDISHTGMFVATTHVPPHGQVVEVKLAVPSGRKISVSGRVVRARVTSLSMAQTDPSGFSLQVDGYHEEFFQYLSSLEAGGASGR